MATFVEITWSSLPRKITTVCSVIGALTGTIIGIAKATPIAEPWWYASRGYVRDVNGETMNKFMAADNKFEHKLDSIQLEQAEGKSEAVDNDLFKAGLELKKAADDATREYIQQHINQLNSTKDKLKSQIETLRKGSRGN